MKDEDLMTQIARHVRAGKNALQQGSPTDARRYAERADNLLIVLRHARLVRAAARFSTTSPQPISSS